MSELINIVENTSGDSKSFKNQLLKDFPFLEEQIAEILSKFQEFNIGIPEDDEIDPETYESFSINPAEELYWRTDWKDNGFFSIATFYILGEETDVSVNSKVKSSQLYLWKINEENSKPFLLNKEFGKLIEECIENAETIAQYMKTIEA